MSPQWRIQRTKQAAVAVRAFARSTMRYPTRHYRAFWQRRSCRSRVLCRKGIVRCCLRILPCKSPSRCTRRGRRLHRRRHTHNWTHTRRRSWTHSWNGCCGCGPHRRRGSYRRRRCTPGAGRCGGSRWAGVRAGAADRVYAVGVPEPVIGVDIAAEAAAPVRGLGGHRNDDDGHRQQDDNQPTPAAR